MRDKIRIAQLIIREGFTDFVLRKIIMVFMDNHSPLAETLYTYDKLTVEAKEIHVNYNGKMTTYTFKK